MANYDQSGLRFPIQKLILGPRALKMFGSQENNRLVTHILSEKLYEYLSNTKISLEVNDGEAILDARMPPLSIVDRCDISLKERFKLSVNQSNVTFWFGDYKRKSQNYKQKSQNYKQKSHSKKSKKYTERLFAFLTTILSHLEDFIRQVCEIVQIVLVT